MYNMYVTVETFTSKCWNKCCAFSFIVHAVSSNSDTLRKRIFFREIVIDSRIILFASNVLLIYVIPACYTSFPCKVISTHSYHCILISFGHVRKIFALFSALSNIHSLHRRHFFSRLLYNCEQVSRARYNILSYLFFSDSDKVTWTFSRK